MVGAEKNVSGINEWLEHLLSLSPTSFRLHTYSSNVKIMAEMILRNKKKHEIDEIKKIHTHHL